MEGPVDNLVRAFATHLEAAEASGLSRATMQLYDGRYKQYLSYLNESGYDPPFGLDLLQPQLVRRAANWLRDRSNGPRGGQHAARMLVCVLKIGSAWLADEGYIDFDLLARVKRPKATSSARLPYSQDEVRALVGAAALSRTGSRDIAAIRLMMDTGMRSGGLCSILLQDLDLRERRVRLRLKGGREHALYFGDPDRRDGGGTVRALRRYLADRELIVQASEKRGRDRSQGHLFLGYDGRPLEPSGFHQALKVLAAAAHVENAFPHRFRHTFATLYLVRHPGDETGLRDILGHLSMEMLKTYTHLAHEIIAQRAGRVALSEAWLGDEDVVTHGPARPVLIPAYGGHTRTARQ